MRSKITKRFRGLMAKLPAETQEHARQAYRDFVRDPFDPTLKLKELRGRSTYWSVRIGLYGRAVGSREEDLITWFWIGSHADYDNLVERLR